MIVFFDAIRSLDLFWIIAEGIELTLRGTPVLINLDKRLKVDTLVEELLKGLAALYAEFLQCYPLVADNDALLGVTLHIDGCMDIDALRCLLERIDTHFHAVGYLLVVIQEDLLTDNL